MAKSKGKHAAGATPSPMPDPSTLSEQESEKTPKKWSKVTLIVVGVLVAIVAVVYGAGLLYFSGHLYPKSDMSGTDMSLMSDAQAKDAMDDYSSKYKLHVTGDGIDLTFSKENGNIAMDTDKVITAIHETYPAFAWPIEVFKKHDLSSCVTANYDEKTVTDTVSAAVDAINETATGPTNAGLEYDAEARTFKVKPETYGTMLNKDAVLKTVKDAATHMRDKAELGKDELVQPTLFADDSRFKAAIDEANGFVKADVTLMMNGVQAAKIDAPVIATWVGVDENVKASLSEEAMTNWVNDLVTGLDTVGTTRTYTTPDGATYTVSGGDYGWCVDNAGLQEQIVTAIKEGKTEVIEVPCTQTAAGFNGVGQQDWGSRYIDINLSDQYVKFYDNGSVIWESACISGKPDGEHDTPTGVYDINTKASPQTLIGYKNGQKIYESYVTYWMPFKGNAIGLHDATWQPGFGGQMYRQGYGSHGCVNLPYSAAEALYGIVNVGDVVVVHW